MLTKKTGGVATGSRLTKALAGIAGKTVDRRTFLKGSGLAAGGVALASVMPGTVKKAEAAAPAAAGDVSIVKSV